MRIPGQSIGALSLRSRPVRLLVTGGAGYIGSIVAQQLLARGDDVTVLDSLARGHRAAVPEGAALVQADLLNTEALRGALAGGFDRVLHFPAPALGGAAAAFPQRHHPGHLGRAPKL